VTVVGGVRCEHPAAVFTLTPTSIHIATVMLATARIAAVDRSFKRIRQAAPTCIPRQSTPQTAFRSVRPFCGAHGRDQRQTDQAACDICTNGPHLALVLAMRAKYTRSVFVDRALFSPVTPCLVGRVLPKRLEDEIIEAAFYSL